MRRALVLALVVAGMTGAVWALAAPSPGRTAGLGPKSGPRPAVLAQAGTTSPLVARGRALFAAGCASCHGFDAKGVKGQGPSLRGAGALSADFYLSTGRMPLNNPADPPVRSHPTYTRAEIAALTAYVGSLGGDPIPRVDPAAGTLVAGRKSFTEHCAGCHQVMARGGIVTGAIAPPLAEASPRQIAEAVRIGPYLMPSFDEKQIDDRTLSSIARYVVWASRHPDDRGGWGIGNIGPIPEGMVAWFIGIAALLLVIRLIGERTKP